MLKLAFYFLFVTFASGQLVSPGDPIYQPYPQFYNFNPLLGSYHLCTYKTADFDKCLHTVEMAKLNAIPLALQCVQREDRDNCIRSVSEGSSDMTVLTGHGYKEARREGLQPVLFAREDESSLTIAVVPRNITVADLQEAPLVLDESNHRAFHAAAYFNLQRGHDICAFAKVLLGPYIRIEDSASYEPTDDEILICSNRLTSEFEGYKQCNVEAGLQRAVFVRSGFNSDERIYRIRQIFQTILNRFGPGSPLPNREGFNFFQTYEGHDNVIFKNNTIAFDLMPTYRNGVNETVFNYLHCNNDQQPHDPRNLL